MTGFAGMPPAAIGPPDFVLDAAIAVAWAVPALASTYSGDVQFSLIRRVATVPTTWMIEVADALLAAVRRGQLTAAEVSPKLSTLAGYRIHVDNQTATRAWGDTLAVARTRRISVARAAYLELALRLQLPLATAEPALTRAATVAGVSIYAP